MHRCHLTRSPLCSIYKGIYNCLPSLSLLVSFYCLEVHYDDVLSRKLEIVRDDAASNASSGSTSIFYKGRFIILVLQRLVHIFVLQRLVHTFSFSKAGPIDPVLRLGFCQKIYMTQFSGQRILHTENA